MPELKRNILLSGVVGSTAYGLAGPDSDVDRLGLFAYNTLDLLGLDALQDSIVEHEPDVTMHEALKYVRLALKCNPTVLELMFLPEYEQMSRMGQELLFIRDRFLSARLVRDAYLGYATQQFTRLKNRGGTSFDSDIPARRVAKHARHLMRLCYQGFHLYATGELVIRLEHPETFREFGEAVAEGNIGVAEELIASYETLFDMTPTVLPDGPDRDAVERWLKDVRLHYWT
jgi:predicted nucleotidyltransferase